MFAIRRGIRHRRLLAALSLVALRSAVLPSLGRRSGASLDRALDRRVPAASPAPRTRSSYLGLAGFALFAIWVVVVSILMLRTRARARRVAPAFSRSRQRRSDRAARAPERGTVRAARRPRTRHARSMPQPRPRRTPRPTQRGNGGPSSSTISMSIARCVLRAHHPERPDGQVVDLARLGIDGHALVSTHPIAMWAAPIAYDRSTISSSGSPAATRTATRAIVPPPSMSTRTPRRVPLVRRTRSTRVEQDAAPPARHAASALRSTPASVSAPSMSTARSAIPTARNADRVDGPAAPALDHWLPRRCRTAIRSARRTGRPGRPTTPWSSPCPASYTALAAIGGRFGPKPHDVLPREHDAHRSTEVVGQLAAAAATDRSSPCRRTRRRSPAATPAPLRARTTTRPARGTRAPPSR